MDSKIRSINREKGTLIFSYYSISKVVFLLVMIYIYTSQCSHNSVICGSNRIEKQNGKYKYMRRHLKIRSHISGVKFHTLMLESLIKSSSATTSNYEIGSDNPKMMMLLGSFLWSLVCIDPDDDPT